MRAYSLAGRSQAARAARLAGAVTLPYFILVALGLRGGAIRGDSVLPLLATGFVLTIVALALALYAFLEIWRVGLIGTGDALMAVLYATPAATVTAVAAVALFSYPDLNDVSTDLAELPAFNTAATMTPATSPDPALQREAYPDIVGRVYPVTLPQFYPAIKEVIAGRGWTIVRDRPPPDFDPNVARLPRARPRFRDNAYVAPALPSAEIEAIAPTPVFAFPDRLSIRLRADEEGARLDMRSASALGTHDLGANVRRIRGLYREVDTLVQERFAGVGPATRPEEEPAEIPAE